MGYNFAVCILKIIACYWVVSIHFGRTLPCHDLAVPVFMFLAFYYSTFLFERDWQTCRRRVVRLAIPYIIWGVLGFCFRCVNEHKIDWLWLMKQFLFGQAANSPLYFILLCVINTILIWMILKVFGNEWGVAILGVLSVGMLLIQYCGVNVGLWDWLPVHGRMTFGRFFELFPYSVIGLIMGKLRSHVDLSGAVIVHGMTLIVIWGVIEWFGCLELSGFGYAGLPRILGSVGISLIALALGDWRLEIGAGKIIAYLASLTAGIYYMHKIVGSVIKFVMPALGGYVLTLVVFVVCALCCALIKRSRALAILVK